MTETAWPDAPPVNKKGAIVDEIRVRVEQATPPGINRAEERYKQLLPDLLSKGLTGGNIWVGCGGDWEVSDDYMCLYQKHKLELSKSQGILRVIKDEVAHLPYAKPA